MIWVDRCGFCKHGAKDDKLPFTCKAFPNGRPRGFREKTGKECNNTIDYSQIGISHLFQIIPLNMCQKMGVLVWSSLKI